jgi:hypothetical protein
VSPGVAVGVKKKRHKKVWTLLGNINTFMLGLPVGDAPNQRFKLKRGCCGSLSNFELLIFVFELIIGLQWITK